MMNDHSQPSSAMPDAFDRLLGALHGLPDVLNTRPTTIRSVTPILGTSQMFTVQTYRQRDLSSDPKDRRPSRDTIFLECLSKDGAIRIAIPPEVANAIARQREALSERARSLAAKTVANERKERGELPGFMKAKLRR